MEQKYERLKLENQLCFPLYACSREIIKNYGPALKKLGLTYTQYITMMVLWERERISAKELGTRLFLDSGTLTPVLKSLEAKGYVKRTRDGADERLLICSLTPQGEALKEAAAEVPLKAAACLNLDPEEAGQLYALLYKMLDNFQ